MPLMAICDRDPMITTLRNTFGAQPLRIPEERVRPLTVIASKDGRTAFRGALAPLVTGTPPLEFHPEDISTSQMSGAVSKHSSTVNFELGMNILEGLLQGFGIPSAGFRVKFQGATEVSFHFEDVIRAYVDTNWLGRVVAGRKLDLNNPAMAIFFGPESYKMLVIDSVITSSNFAISVDRSNSADFKLDVPAIQQMIAQAKLDVQVSSTSGLDLSFTGAKALTFAFSCVQFYLGQDGAIKSIPPEFSNLVGLVGAGGSNPLLYSPDRVLLGSEPALVSWDE